MIIFYYYNIAIYIYRLNIYPTVKYNYHQIIDKR